MPNGSKIFIVDDEEHLLDLVQDTFSACGFECETFASADKFVARAPWSEVGCLILDLRMPRMSGLQLIELCQEKDPAFAIVVYSATADVRSAVESMRRGAVYVFEKGRNLDEMVPLVREAVAISRARDEARQLRERTRKAMETLTDREREVLHQIAAGHANKVIADELGISINTVEIHRGRVMRKMGFDSVAELARALASLGL